MHDPRAATVATKYLRVLNEIQALGMPGFSTLIDTASEDEISELLDAADVILENVERVKRHIAV
jgi:hypothetical protein